MRSLILALLLITSIHAETPELLVTPSAPAAPVEPPKKGQPNPLDIGKMTWVSKPDYTGPLTFDVTGGDAVGIFPIKSEAEFPTFRQGLPNASVVKAPKSGSEVLAVFGQKPGVVVIVAWGIKDAKPYKVAQTTISVAGAKPTPIDDGKKDDVNPTPAKIHKGFVVCLYDDKMLTPEYALLGDTDWKRSLETIPGVLDFRTYDVTLPEADNGALKKGYLAKANEFRKDQKVSDWSKPVMLFLSEDSKVADIRFMPSTKPAVESVIKGVIRP